MSIARTTRLRILMSAALAVAAALCTAPRLRAQSPSGSPGPANMNWQQRFMGILPLVKLDPKDPVMVTVDTHPITAAEITDYAHTERQMINATSSEETLAVFKDATENLINRQLLIDEAARRKIEIPDAQVAERAREFKVAGGAAPALPGAASDPQLIAAVRGSMMIEKMLDDEFRTQTVRPTDAQIKQYYDEHKDLFVKDAGEVRISHIAVKLPDNPTAAQKAAAHDKILKLYKEAQHSKDFAALAKANSEDSQTAPNGGDLGFFHPGQLPPVVDKQVFATPAGHLTDIFESNLGYSFIKVTERRGETFATLKEAQPKIAIVLLDYNQSAVVKKTLQQLQRKAKIEFHKPPPDAGGTPHPTQVPD
ncbi:MAG TPA: peptidylprolyl isomerase [Candidatus Binataceae bacterium]|nr:peptidylprolyl isomerase [Candidatus Binataceae bacterium]